MARILIADKGPSDSTLIRLLEPSNELRYVTTLPLAANALAKQSFDLIIIDLHFDESRMLDLLHLIKTMPQNADKPVICFISKETELSQIFHDSMTFTAKALGAWMVLDAHGFGPDPRAELNRLIERCLTGQARKATQAAREDLHRRRQEIHQLRLKIQNTEWSAETAEQLEELRQNLTALLIDLCDLQMNSISQQELIDDFRERDSSRYENVVAAENKATRRERKQTLDELHHAVEEFDAAKKEEESKSARSQRKSKSDEGGKRKPQKN